jgi:hypothetical protein
MKTRSQFPQMARIVKPGSQGVATVDHFTVTEADAERTRFYSALRGDRYAYVPAGKYARLKVGGTLMMTDTQMERITNSELLRRAHGRVLIGGLGLGMVVHGIMKKPEVAHVTVIEKYQDVVDLVMPTLKKYGRRVTIITADILEWAPPKGEKWDTIYMDIWPDVCEDNLPEMAKLSRRLSPRLNRPGGWMGGWRIEELRDRRRSGRY